MLSSRVPNACKRHPVLATVLAWLIVMTPVGMTAEAAFHLEYVDEPTKGLSFMPEVIGLRTTPAPSYTPLRASGTAQGPSVRIVEPQGDFWRALADCESPTGYSGRYIGYFQFSRGGTANAVGIDGSESYEEQRSAAQDWASRVSNPGSTAGWPVCWWRAKAAVGYAPK